jgi:hypothetical protein
MVVDAAVSIKTLITKSTIRNFAADKHSRSGFNDDEVSLVLHAILKEAEAQNSMGCIIRPWNTRVNGSGKISLCFQDDEVARSSSYVRSERVEEQWYWSPEELMGCHPHSAVSFPVVLNRLHTRKISDPFCFPSSLVLASFPWSCDDLTIPHRIFVRPPLPGL